MRIEKKKLTRTALILVLLVGLAGFGTGCQKWLGDPSEQAAPMVKVEIYFNGNPTPLIGSIKSLDFEKNATFFQGGSSVIPVYDEQGNQIAVFNYSRVDVIKILP